MRVAWERASRVPPWPLAAVLVGALWLGLVLTAEYVARRSPNRAAPCPMKRLTGCPCPGCGTTRAGLSALRGDVTGAVACNPVVTVLCGLVAALLLVRLVWARRLNLDLGPIGRRVAWCAAILAVLANWGYVIWAGM